MDQEHINYLNVSVDAQSHALRFGAKRDPQSGRWYAIDPVHRELLNYLSKEPNHRFMEVAPSCPRCGAPMRKFNSKAGRSFWGCVAYFNSGCRGKIDYLDYLNETVPVLKVGDFLPKLVGSLFSPSPLTNGASGVLENKSPNPLRQRWIELVRQAFETLGSERKAILWLYESKISLRSKAPIEVLGTESGCERVQQLLLEVWK